MSVQKVLMHRDVYTIFAVYMSKVGPVVLRTKTFSEKEYNQQPERKQIHLQ